MFLNYNDLNYNLLIGRVINIKLYANISLW